jgi:hypothetical protein
MLEAIVITVAISKGYGWTVVKSFSNRLTKLLLMLLSSPHHLYYWLLVVLLVF